MNKQETQYLNMLFAKTSGEADESEVDFPLVDVPKNLSQRLYAVSESAQIGTEHSEPRRNRSWPKFASVAASVLMVVVVLQLYQQQQTLNQLEQAQDDLATALQYLGEANQITQAQMLNTLNSNMKKAAITPVIDIGRDAVSPTLESFEQRTKKTHRTL